MASEDPAVQRRTMRTLVLGGTGLLGAAISSAHLTAGHDVSVLARGAPGSDLAGALRGARLIQGSVTDSELLAQALEGVDHVVHAVGCPFPAESLHDPMGDLYQTIPGLLSLLELLRHRTGVRLSFISSGGTIYGNVGADPVSEDRATHPVTAYGITKLAAERYIGMYSELYGITATVLRVSNAYGPRQQATRGQGVIAAFLEASRAGGTVRIFGDGSVVRDYVNVADIALAEVRSAKIDLPSSTINVGSGVGHSLREVLAAVKKVTGSPLAVEWLPVRDFDIKHVVLDVSRLRSLIPWTPVELTDGIQEMFDKMVSSNAFVA